MKTVFICISTILLSWQILFSQNNAIPTAPNPSVKLGMGYDDLFLEEKSQAFEGQAERLGTGKNTVIKAEKIITTEDYSRFTEANVSLRGKLGILRAKGKASYKDYVTRSSNEIIFMAVATVTNPKYILKNPKPKKEFLDNARKYPDKFRKVYGNSYISEVTTGAECALIFSIKTESESKFLELKNFVSGKVGTVSGRADFSQTITQLNAIQQFTWKVVVNGVNEIPQPDLDKALNYVFNFPNLVTDENYVPLEYSTKKYTSLDVLLPYIKEEMVDNNHYRGLSNCLHNANYMYHQLEDWNDEVQYIINNQEKFDNVYVTSARGDVPVINGIKNSLIAKILQIINDNTDVSNELENLVFDRKYYSLKNHAAPPNPIRIRPR